MKRALAILAVTALVVPFLGVAGADAAYVSITDVAVTPTQPAPGELVTVTPTVRNLQDSPYTFTVTDVALRKSSSSSIREYDRVEDLGTLAPGTSIAVPLTVRFDDPGVYELRVHVYGRDSNDSYVHVQYPVVVRVSDEHPQVEIDAGNGLVANVDNRLNVTVANGLDTAVRNVELTLRGDGVEFDRERRVIASLGAGEARSFPFTASVEEPGDRTLVATLTYATPDGNRREVTSSETVTVDRYAERVALHVKPRESTVTVDLSNLGDSPVENVVVQGRAPGLAVSSARVESLPAGDTRTVDLSVSGANPGDRYNLTVVAAYQVDGSTERTEASVPVVVHPGEISLTGIDVEQEGDTLHITGSASNVGLTDVDAVLVSVVAADGVEPAYPNREYFVGTVPRSDFVSFDVYATVDDGVTTIPLRVTYLSNGDRQERTMTVEYDDAAASPSSPAENRGACSFPGWSGASSCSLCSASSATRGGTAAGTTRSRSDGRHRSPGGDQALRHRG
ncbi:COG1361 S-layer family protein [Halobacteriaceae archaeon GCM10025711]